MEIVSIHFVQFLHLKKHLYTNPSEFPYLLLVYTPLYYYTMTFVVNLLSIDVINNIHHLYVAGRMISLGLFFLNLYLFIKLIKQFHPNFKKTILLILFIVLLVPKHFYSFRPDSFKVTFFILFIYFGIKYISSGLKKDFWLSFIFLLTGIYFKQDLLLYGLSFYVIYFLIYRKTIYLYALTLLLCLICISIYLMYAVTGINLFKDLLLYNIQYDDGLHTSFLFIGINILRTLPLLFFTVKNLLSKNKVTLSLSILSVVYYFISNFSMLRVGSNINYTYESIFLLLLNVILFLNTQNIRHIKIFTFLYILLLCLIPTNYYLFYYNKEKEAAKKNAYQSTISTVNKIKEIVQNDVLFLPNMKYTVMFANNNLIYGYDWHYDRFCELYYSIQLKPKFLKNDIVAQYDTAFSSGVVKYIVVEDEPKSINQLNKYYAQFKVLQKVDSFIIYKYNKKTDSQ